MNEKIGENKREILNLRIVWKDTLMVILSKVDIF